ncbi:MAG TPA: helix-turn-helix domain-containing protein [Solirubrobacteraceae bacterium]|nr:helix-turn-helix domain-containing protein [Solirubrobacteraceae bacterium]
MEPNTVAPTRLLTIPDAAERLALSARTIEKLIAAGEISPLRIGRSVRLADAEIEQFIERKRHNDHERPPQAPVGKEGAGAAQATG